MSEAQPIPEESLEGIEYVGMPDAPDTTNAEEPKPAEEPLELGGEDAPEATPEQIEDEKKKTRSHSLTNRVNALTARLREAERRAAEAEARVTPQTEAEPKAPTADDKNPDGSDKYEFGEADPQYIKDVALFEVRKELADERKKAAETDKANGERADVISKLNEGMAAIEKGGAEKYDDFEEKISEAVDQHGALSVPVSIAVAVSPVGADVAYRLATDADAREKIEKLAQTSIPSAALAFGQLEGEALPADHDDSDLNLNDPLDMLRLNGRMKARLAGKGGTANQVERKTSKAPEPPESRARGAGGRFTPDWSDEKADLNALGKLLG